MPGHLAPPFGTSNKNMAVSRLTVAPEDVTGDQGNSRLLASIPKVLGRPPQGLGEAPWASGRSPQGLGEAPQGLWEPPQGLGDAAPRPWGASLSCLWEAPKALGKLPKAFGSSTRPLESSKGVGGMPKASRTRGKNVGRHFSDVL